MSFARALFFFLSVEIILHKAMGYPGVFLKYLFVFFQMSSMLEMKDTITGTVVVCFICKQKLFMWKKHVILYLKEPFQPSIYIEYKNTVCVLK